MNCFGTLPGAAVGPQCVATCAGCTSCVVGGGGRSTPETTFGKQRVSGAQLLASAKLAGRTVEERIEDAGIQAWPTFRRQFRGCHRTEGHHHRGVELRLRPRHAVCATKKRSLPAWQTEGMREGGWR